jgi:hypothetical protein
MKYELEMDKPDVLVEDWPVNILVFLGWNM